MPRRLTALRRPLSSICSRRSDRPCPAPASGALLGTMNTILRNRGRIQRTTATKQTARPPEVKIPGPRRGSARFGFCPAGWKYQKSKPNQTIITSDESRRSATDWRPVFSTETRSETIAWRAPCRPRRSGCWRQVEFPTDQSEEGRQNGFSKLALHDFRAQRSESLRGPVAAL